MTVLTPLHRIPQKLQPVTIERLLAKTDLELGIEGLLGIEGFNG